MEPLIENIIFFTISLLMLFLTIYKGQRSSIAICLLFTIANLLMFFKTPFLAKMRFLFFTISFVSIFLYGFISKKNTIPERVFISLSGFCALTFFAIHFLHWPGANLIKLYMALPIIAYFTFCFLGFYKKPAFGFMTIATTIFCAILFNFLHKLHWFGL